MAGPDAKNTETPYPIWSFGPPSPEPDTKDLDALLTSLNGSAERFQTLWFSFLGLTLYLAIAALATTHRNLLLGEPQTLPILNIKVELLPFYIIAPLLYLVFHFYLLMMLALLARTAAEFDKQLRTTLPGEPERERYRAQVGNALFLQLLVGMKGERTGINAFFMGLIAFITIVLAPLATLVLMQMMFLPYHHLRITWWHRGIVVADLVLIVVMTYRCFFHRGVTKAPLVLGALNRKPRWATAIAFCVLLAFGLFHLVDWLSFCEGRWAGEPTPSSFEEWPQWMAGDRPPSPQVNPDFAATANGVVFGLFPNRLKLREETIVGKEKLDKAKEEMASRNGANKTAGEDDFVPTIKLDERDLQAADLSGADVRGVSLDGALLQGSNLVSARLDGARLIGADLRGAIILTARLPGADLTRAQLQGTNLVEARLQGANLIYAQLQGALLYGAELRGADLGEAQLQGAQLSHAQLQGAKLEGAQLQGAGLRQAELQGADLSGAALTDSGFDETFVFRTDIADADLTTAAVRSVYAEQVKVSARSGSPPEPLTPADVEAWITVATQFASEENKAAIAELFARLKPDFREGVQEATWSGMQEASFALDPDGAQHRQRLAKLFGDLACDVEGAYVARGLFESHRLTALRDQLGAFRTRLEEGRKTSEKCPGVAGFTEDDWRRLDAIKPTKAEPTNH